MSIVGVDLGDRRCGIALEKQGIAFAQETVARHNIISVLKKYILEYQVGVIVVGLPFDLYDKDTHQLDKTRKFIEKLEYQFPQCQVVGVDERFTSFAADQSLSEIGKQDIGDKDALAAAEILETYLHQKK